MSRAMAVPVSKLEEAISNNARSGPHQHRGAPLWKVPRNSSVTANVREVFFRDALFVKLSERSNVLNPSCVRIYPTHDRMKASTMDGNGEPRGAFCVPSSSPEAGLGTRLIQVRRCSPSCRRAKRSIGQRWSFSCLRERSGRGQWDPTGVDSKNAGRARRQVGGGCLSPATSWLCFVLLIKSRVGPTAR